MGEFGIEQWLIAVVIVLVILGVRRLRWFKAEVREVPLGVEAAWPAVVRDRNATGEK